MVCLPCCTRRYMRGRPPRRSDFASIAAGIGRFTVFCRPKPLFRADDGCLRARSNDRTRLRRFHPLVRRKFPRALIGCGGGSDHRRRFGPRSATTLTVSRSFPDFTLLGPHLAANNEARHETDEDANGLGFVTIRIGRFDRHRNGDRRAGCQSRDRLHRTATRNGRPNRRGQGRRWPSITLEALLRRANSSVAPTIDSWKNEIQNKSKISIKRNI